MKSSKHEKGYLQEKEDLPDPREKEDLPDSTGKEDLPEKEDLPGSTGKEDFPDPWEKEDLPEKEDPREKKAIVAQKGKREGFLSGDLYLSDALHNEPVLWCKTLESGLQR